MEIRGRRATTEEVAALTARRYGQPARPGHATERTNWDPVADGSWWLVHDDRENFRRAFERIKRGSKRWADRNGLIRHLRRNSAEGKVWVRFEREEIR